jgi:hypothetical protein
MPWGWLQLLQRPATVSATAFFHLGRNELVPSELAIIASSNLVEPKGLPNVDLVMAGWRIRRRIEPPMPALQGLPTKS